MLGNFPPIWRRISTGAVGERIEKPVVRAATKLLRVPLFIRQNTGVDGETGRFFCVGVGWRSGCRGVMGGSSPHVPHLGPFGRLL
jgi:hypothetical protein